MSEELTKEQEAKNYYTSGMECHAQGDLTNAYEFLVKACNTNDKISAYFMALAMVENHIVQKSDNLRDYAVIHAQHAARMEPEKVDNWVALGEISLASYKYPESIAAYECAISLNHEDAKVWSMLGFAHQKAQSTGKAKLCYEKCLSLDNELGQPHFLLSMIYNSPEYFDLGKMAYHGEKAFTVKSPSSLSVESCWNAATGFLGIGEYEKGWTYYESRLNYNLTNKGQLLPHQRFKQPIWRGETQIDGERKAVVLIHAEMGLGDSFLMCRYLPVVRSLFDVEIIFECQKHMIDLVRYNFPDIKCIEYGQGDDTVFDYNLPMMSLPLICMTKGYTKTWDGVYFRAQPEKIEQWKNASIFMKDKLNVGLCWAAGKNSYNAENHETSRRKSVPFNLISPLLQRQDVNYIPLQIERMGEIDKLDIKDFSDTAALIELCDIVICVDSSVANLAGAMGKEVWLFDRFDHCWRYSFDHWYPTIKVFRQPVHDDWQNVISRISAELDMRCAKMAA